MGTEESDPRFMQYKIESTQAEVEERKGVLHIVQGWIQQKQPEKVSLTHVPVWQHIAQQLPLKRVFFYLPNSLIVESASVPFGAGVWLEDDPGPWLGRAIIYKLNELIHVDASDKSPSVSFPCGEYIGREMIVPQLDTKFR